MGTMGQCPRNLPGWDTEGPAVHSGGSLIPGVWDAWSPRAKAQENGEVGSSQVMCSASS
jgi:hypothetical protein